MLDTAQDTDGRRGEGHALTDELVREVAVALEAGDAAAAAELVRRLHAADQADLIQLLRPDERAELVAALGNRLDPEVLSYLDETVRGEVIERLGPQAAGAAIARLAVDDAIDVLSGLDADLQLALLRALPELEREAIEQGLAYPEESAGRLMQRAVVAMPEYWTVGQTIDYLRASPNLPDEFYDIYLVDPRYRPVGSIPLSRVLRSRREVALRDVQVANLHPIPVHTDREEVAFIFRQYGLVSAPVVSPEGRLLGVITVDDVVEVVQEETEEDALRLSGVAEVDIFASPWRSSRHRLPWLLISFISAGVAATVIHLFEESIEQLVALAVLMPIIAALGGSSGVQTLAVIVRALAVRELTRSNALRVMVKEIGVGALNSTGLMIVGVIITLLWFGSPGLAAVFGAAIVLTVLAAALIGFTVPLLLDRLGFDPAVSSSVFVTPTIDVIAFFTFLGLATLYLL